MAIGTWTCRRARNHPRESKRMEQSITAHEFQKDIKRFSNGFGPTSLNFRPFPKGLQANNAPNDYHLVLNYPHLLWHHITHEYAGWKHLY